MTPINERRGIRNNNPGNIDYNPTVKWQGLDTPPIEKGVPKPRFARFKSPTYGIRAIARLLITYYDKHGLNTTAQIFNRYAPPVENNTNAYAYAVASDIGDALGKDITVNTVINVHDWRVLRPLVTGIIEHENGLSSYKQVYDDAVIDKALVLAGVEPLKKSLAKSRTMQGALLGASSLAAVTAEQLEPIVLYSDYIKYVFLFLTLVGIAIMAYARFDDYRRGLR